MKQKNLKIDPCIVCMRVVFTLLLCYGQSDENASSATSFVKNTTTTTTTTTTNQSHATKQSATNDQSDSDSDSDSKPWLSRIFSSTPNKAAASGEQPVSGDFNAAKHFDLRNVRHDFNRPAGNKAASGTRNTKTGRKISYAGRPCGASTATGSKAQHNRELNALLADAISV